MKAAFIAALALSLIAGMLIDPHAHFPIERLFAFYALYGFLACAALILLAKGIGLLVKRADTYYDDEPG